MTDARLQATTFGYDAAGNRISMRDRKGATHSYAYDQVNRLTQVSAGGLTVSHAYDANGNRTSLTDGGGTTTFAYDSLERLTRKTTPDNRSVQYAYDRTGNRTRLTYPDGATAMAYAYDPANRLTQLTVGTLSWTLSYDAAGNRAAIAQPNGTRTEYAYLANNWLQAITHKRPDGATFQSFTYGHDANGNRLSQVDFMGIATFGYDPLDRLTAASYPGTYGNWSWGYDAVGNRTSQTAPSGTTPYTYDENNRLTAAGAVNYSYDPNGNLTGTTAGQSFSWDVFNRLTQASGSGGQVSYTYNGDGLKVRRAGPEGGATVYYYDGIRPIWEADGAGTPKVQLDRDIFGNLLGRREVSSGVRRYFAHDGLGGLTGTTDEAGTHVASLFYDAWGNLRASGGTWTAGNYRFTGAELDPATGLYHMGARFYDPGLGRLRSEDAIQDRYFEPSTLNYYAYASGNPLRYIDPNGMDLQDKVLEWLKDGFDAAVVKVREFYAQMAEVARQLIEALGLESPLIARVGIITAIAFLAMPDPQSQQGLLVDDFLKNPAGWHRAGISITRATGRQYRDAISIKVAWERARDRAALGFHLIMRERNVLHLNLRFGVIDEILKWLGR